MQKRKQVGIYARLSVEHGNEKDNSIENQILLARNWVARKQKQGEQIEEFQCYIDRGYSGTSFERPAFLQLLEDARMGKIQCIVCKDSSRLGRNYLKTGEYMEKIFPRLGIRLVCIGDNYDSEKGMPGSLEGNLKNLMNEWYARDIGRKVSLVKQRQKREGNYLGSVPPYGYRIVRQEGKRVLKEEKTIAIVHEICRQREQGESLEQIKEWLYRKKINPPAQYRKEKRMIQEGVVKKWDITTLKKIIEHQRGLPPG